MSLRKILLTADWSGPSYAYKAGQYVLVRASVAASRIAASLAVAADSIPPIEDPVTPDPPNLNMGRGLFVDEAAAVGAGLVSGDFFVTTNGSVGRVG